MSRSLLLLVSLLLLSAVNCGGGSDDNIVTPNLPTFSPDRTNPQANEIYLRGQAVSEDTLELGI